MDMHLWGIQNSAYTLHSVIPTMPWNLIQRVLRVFAIMKCFVVVVGLTKGPNSWIPLLGFRSGLYLATLGEDGIYFGFLIYEESS